MDLQGKNIAVTGASGFLGRRISQKLEDQGARVIKPRSKDYDFTSEQDTKKFYEDHNLDGIVHSAALYGGLGINKKMPAEIYDINMRMMLNLFKHSIDYETKKPRIEKMVAIGSACGYPSSLGTNMKEEKMWDGPVDASVRNYGTIKKLMETTGHVYRDQFGLHSINLQLATLYGENDTFNPERSHVPAALTRKFVEAKQQNKPHVELWGVPDTVREFMYVGDAAEGIVKAMKDFDQAEGVEDQSKYTLNLGTGEGVTIDQLAKTIKKITDYKGDMQYTGKSPGQKEKALVVDRMKKELNWEPKHSLEEGLRKTINWYMENKEEADKRF